MYNKNNKNKKVILTLLSLFLFSFFFFNLVSAFGYGNKDTVKIVNVNATNSYYNISGGGNFTSTQFQDAFNSNWTALDYDKWMYNMTVAGTSDGATNSSYEYWTNVSINQWLYNQSDGSFNMTYDTWLSNYTLYNIYWYNMSDGSGADGATNSSYMTSITNASYMTSITNSSYDYTAGSNLTLIDNKFSLNVTALTEWLDTLYATIGSYFSFTDFQDAFDNNVSGSNINSNILGNASSDGSTNSSYFETSNYQTSWDSNLSGSNVNTNILGNNSGDGSTNTSYLEKTDFTTGFNANLTGAVNSTQMTFTDNILTILESWLKSLFYTRTQVDDYIAGNSSADGATNSSYEYWTNRSLDADGNDFATNSSYFEKTNYQSSWDSNLSASNVNANILGNNSADGSTNSSYFQTSNYQTAWDSNLSGSNVNSNILGNTSTDGSTNSSYFETANYQTAWDTNLSGSSVNTNILGNNSADGSTNSSYEYWTNRSLDADGSTNASYFLTSNFQTDFESNLSEAVNSTQMTFTDNILTILESWLKSLFYTRTQVDDYIAGNSSADGATNSSYEYWTNRSLDADGNDFATNSSYMTSITNASYMTSITNSSYLTSSAMDYTNIALTNISNTFAENQTLSESLVLSESKYIQMGVGYMLYNGTCMNMKGSTSTLSIC